MSLKKEKKTKKREKVKSASQTKPKISGFIVEL